MNAEARAAAQADSLLRDISIFLQPVEYNADVSPGRFLRSVEVSLMRVQTIRKLATFFGPLENFGLYPGVFHGKCTHGFLVILLYPTS